MVKKVCAEPGVPTRVPIPSPSPEPIMSDQRRPPSRGTEYEDQRTPGHEGEPPHPATEPAGSEGSSNSGETATDPATGEPNP